MKYILLALLASCGYSKEGLPNNPPPPPPPIVEIEPNDSLSRSMFVAVFTPPDMIDFTGSFASATDADWYHFYTPYDQLNSFVIDSDNNSVVEVTIVVHNAQDDTFTTAGHFFGDPGHLAVLNWPVVVEDDGFYLKISSPTHSVADYAVEIWTPGVIH